MSKYAKEYYGVPSDIGREVSYKNDSGIIYKDGGNYIAVNFDRDKPGIIKYIHPNDPDLKYLGMGKLRKMTRGQARYRRYLEYGEGFDNFLDFCYWEKLCLK